MPEQTGTALFLLCWEIKIKKCLSWSLNVWPIALQNKSAQIKCTDSANFINSQTSSSYGWHGFVTHKHSFILHMEVVGSNLSTLRSEYTILTFKAGDCISVTFNKFHEKHHCIILVCWGSHHLKICSKYILELKKRLCNLPKQQGTVVLGKHYSNFQLWICCFTENVERAKNKLHCPCLSQYGSLMYF